MMKFIVFGGTGQCKVIRPILERHGKIIAVVGPYLKFEQRPFSDIPLFVQPVSASYFSSDLIHFVVAIGNPAGKIRVDMSEDISLWYGFIPFSPIHPSALLEEPVGVGCQVHAGAIVNPYAKIGDYVILNTKSLVEHDCIIGDGAEIGPGAVVCGQVKIGKYTWVGAGAVVKDHLTIGENVIIGCGSVVVKDVPDNVVVVGNPAKILRENKDA